MPIISLEYEIVPQEEHAKWEGEHHEGETSEEACGDHHAEEVALQRCAEAHLREGHLRGVRPQSNHDVERQYQEERLR